MKIIIGENPDPLIIGLAAAWTAMKFDVRIWNPTKPIYDVIIETKPDYLILSNSHIDAATVQAVKEFKIKVIIFGVNVPEPLKDNIVLTIIPDVIPQVIANNISEPKFVLHRAANLAQYRGGHFVESMKSDIAHLSIYNTKPSEEIFRQMSGLLPNSPHSLKICGQVRLPCANYVGLISPDEIMNFLSSTKVYIDYDLNFLLECAANKIFTLSNKTNPLFPSFSTDTELVQLIDDFVSNEKARRNVTKKAFKTVISSHTYFHRIVEIGRKIGEDTWEELALQTYQKMRA